MTVIAIDKNLNQINELNNEDCFRCTKDNIESIRNRNTPRIQYNPIRFREQLDFISQTFYSVVGNGQSLIYKMRQPKQELESRWREQICLPVCPVCNIIKRII